MAAVDPFVLLATGGAEALIAASALYFNVTPDDANDLPYVTRAITVGTPGPVKVTRLDGQTVIIPTEVWAVEPVQLIRATRVWQNGTSALHIFAKA